MAGHEARETRGSTARYLIVRHDKAGLLDLFEFLRTGRAAHAFLDAGKKEKKKKGNAVAAAEEEEGADAVDEDDDDDADDQGQWGEPIPGDHRWVIVVSILIRKMIAFFGKPMEWTGILVEFLLNLLSHNGGLIGLLLNLLTGNVSVPRRGSETFISAIGHLDTRVDLHEGGSSLDLISRRPLEVGSKALMDLCIMASKLAYENAHVVRNVVLHRWKMHFVDFYNGWDDYQQEKSTQVFILCDKPKDASLVLISFRGTEPFDADDWSTDFDYSWYEIPKMGRVHMGFLEALGLGNRAQVSTFQAHLDAKRRTRPKGAAASNGSDRTWGSNSIANSFKESELKGNNDDEVTAYYAVRRKLKSLLGEHKSAKFLVTGHSLGGALAILFPAVLLLHGEEELMKRLLGVYTFGQPRVGDGQLERFMEAHVCRPVPKYFRVVYCNDLVPRLPYDNMTFLYKHFGLCLYYNSLYAQQCVVEEPNRNYFGLRYLLPEYLNAAWELIRSLFMGYAYGPEYKETWFAILLRMLGLAMPGISAHSPINYVNSIRLGKGNMQMHAL